MRARVYFLQGNDAEVVHPALSRVFDVVALDAGDVGDVDMTDHTLVLSGNLKDVNELATIRTLISTAKRRGAHVVMAVKAPTHHAIVQSQVLGANDIVWQPFTEKMLTSKIKAPTPKLERTPKFLTSTRIDAKALSASQKLIFDILSLSVDPSAITEQTLKSNSAVVIDAIVEDGVSSWIETVQKHHSQTYRHSLLVLGVAVAFGQTLKLGPREMQRLASAALLHDVGKAKISVDILDKQGPLDARERIAMERHTLYGRNMLTKAGGWSDEMLSLVTSHHEFLDGSGYPHGLVARELPDLVRVLTICDIFAALIEHRSYKASCTADEAFSVMMRMEGKLETALLHAFKPTLAFIEPAQAVKRRRLG